MDNFNELIRKRKQYKAIREDMYKCESKDRLSKILKKKVETTMIGALSSIEEHFSFLWENDGEKLSPEHRNVLRYYALEQLSYEEIAKAMQCSIGTVMSRLFYARKKAQKVFYQTKKRKDYCDSY